jgi:hypothetical protein
MPRKNPKTLPKSKHATKRTELEILRDRKLISDLYIKGWTQEQIGAELKISRDMVQYDLARIREDWQASAVYNFDEAKQKALAELANLKRTAWTAWEKSTKGKKKTKQSTTNDKAGGGSQAAEVVQEESYGDPRFLITIKELVDQECRLLNLYPSTSKTDVVIDTPAAGPGETKVIMLPEWSAAKAKPADAVSS